MFYLRQIDHQGRESNLCLGENYSVIQKDVCAKIFQENLQNAVDECSVFSENAPHIKAFVFTESGKRIPISDFNRNYVLTETGRTYEGLNY